MPKVEEESQQTTHISGDDQTFVKEGEQYTTKEFVKKLVSDAKSDLEEKIGEDKSDVITIFGVFASLFTFLSIEFQVLKTICDFNKVLGFSLIIASVLIFFILFLHMIAKLWLDNFNLKTYLLSSLFVFLSLIVFFGVGLYFISQSGPELNCKTVNSQDNKMESINKLETTVEQLRLKIQELETRQEKPYEKDKNEI